jgi:DinB superfamily
MTTIATDKTTNHTLAARILREGYGDGAWHGPDLKAALAGVAANAAFRRPAPERHNIAEVAVHHAYCVRAVRAKLTGVESEPFVLEGDDWFPIPDASTLSFTAIRDLVNTEQDQLAAIVDNIASGRARSPLTESERIDLVLGITCHAVYHAGQIQLIKALTSGA